MKDYKIKLKYIKRLKELEKQKEQLKINKNGNKHIDRQ